MNTRLRSAAPFWMSLGLVPLAILAAMRGGWWFVLMPVYAWYLVTALDALLGLNGDNPDPETPTAQLFWHRAITVIWFPVQAAVIFGAIWYVAHTGHLGGWEKIGLFFGIGVMSGTIGMVYAHELLHQKPGHERWLGDLLLASTLYSHFRTEHLLVHHSWVATPADAVSARYNEGFFRYFLRVLWTCPRSAWRAETRLLARAGRKVHDRRNPFWRYAALQLGCWRSREPWAGGRVSCCSPGRPSSRSGSSNSRTTSNITGSRAGISARGGTSMSCRGTAGTRATPRRTGCSLISSAIRTTTTSPTGDSRFFKPTRRTRRRNCPSAIRR